MYFSSYHVVSSTSGTDDTGAVKMLDSYNNVIRNEYTVSSTNLAPEYYQKYQQTVPNPCEKFEFSKLYICIVGWCPLVHHLFLKISLCHYYL